jgi:hypothetical protein
MRKHLWNFFRTENFPQPHSTGGLVWIGEY